MSETSAVAFESHEAFARLAKELYRRSGAGATESGAFLLGTVSGTQRLVSKTIFFDDIDPDAYFERAIRFDTTKLSKLYDICEFEGLRIVADVHVHPEEAFLSPIDAKFPVVGVAGHVGIILPYNGRYRTFDQIAAHVYQADGTWLSIEPAAVGSFLGIAETQVSRSACDRIELYLLNSNIDARGRKAVLSETSVAIIVDDRAASTPEGQAAATAAVSLCTRFAKGGVFVSLDRNRPSFVLPQTNVAEALQQLGARIGEPPTSAAIVIGSRRPRHRTFATQLWSRGDTFGCRAYREDTPYESDFIPGAIAATAIGVGEIFRAMIMRRIEAIPRARQITLNGATHLARSPLAIERVGIAGFGHLGNAYAFVLAQMPAIRPALCVLDSQTVDLANASTQLFVVPADIDDRKVEVARLALGRYGFRVTGEAVDIGKGWPGAPAVILSGFDNTPARRALANIPASLIVDGGLGRSASSFSQFSIYSLTDPSSAVDVFSDGGYESDANRLVSTPSYRELEHSGACGLVALADAAVAVPFVGLTVAAIAVTQSLRFAAGINPVHLISGDVLDSTAIVA